RTAVERIAVSLKKLVPRASWVHADRLHLTLEFLGEVDEAVEGHARAALADPIAMPPFSLSLEGLGCFPRSGPPRVIWIGVGTGLEELRRAHAILRKRLGSIDLARDEFVPHLTLARIRDRMPRT